MNRLLILTGLLIFFATCCSTRNQELITEPLTDFENPVISDSVLVKYPYRVNLVDSTLLIFDAHSPLDLYVHLYTYPGLQYVNSVGRRGNGPNEFILIRDMDIKADTLYLFDSLKKILRGYSLTEIIHGDLEPSLNVDFSSIPSTPVLTWTLYGHGMLYLEIVGNQRKLVEIDRDGTVKGETPLYTPNESKVPDHSFPSLWNSVIGVEEESGRAIVATQLGDVIEIVEIESGTHEYHTGPGGEPDVIPEGGRLSIGKIDGYSDVKIAGNIVYALFSGFDREKLLPQTPDGADKLLVYDLSSGIRKYYQLQHHVNGFELDTLQNKMIAVSSNLENFIVIYDLNQIDLL